MEKQNFHLRLKQLMHKYVHLVYDITQNFPKEETFGVKSQFRRAVLSVILNYIEGYARKRKNIVKNFLEISYGSLKESQYLSLFSFERKYIKKSDYDKLTLLEDEILAMLGGIISKM